MIYFDNTRCHVNEAVSSTSNLLFKTMNKALMIHGCMVFDYANEYDECLSKVAEWVKTAQLVYDETVLKELRKLPKL